MASLPFPGTYNPAQHTGDGIYVFDTINTLWLVTNSTPTGAALYNSMDYGTTFQFIINLPGIMGYLAFDPAVAIDGLGNGNIGVIGQIADLTLGGNATNLVFYYYNQVTQVLTGPVTLTNTGIVGSDYDIVALANGNFYVVTEVLDGNTTQLYGFEITAAGTLVRTDDLASDVFRGPGNSYSAISVVTPDGLWVEIYVAVMPRTFIFSVAPSNQFNLAPAQLVQILQQGGTIYSNTVLYTVQTVYVPDNLTVIYNLGNRLLSMSYLNQMGNVLIGNALIGQGFGPAGGSGSWTFAVRQGSLQNSILEPCLFLSPSGVVFAYINVTPATASPLDSSVVLENLS